MANVFISYRTIDFKRVEQLATEIRAAGHQVWLDEWNLQIGDSIIGQINEGLEGALYVIVCYSSEGVDSPWMGREWMSALARQLNGEPIKVLPALLAGDPPPILADIKYADLATNWSKGVAQILTAIR